MDRAALDVAIKLGIPCGGWCPKGRLAEDGRIPDKYPLQETPTSDYAERTAWNVRDSDGTLVLTCGAPTEGTAFTVSVAEELGKPCLVVDVAEPVKWDDVMEWMKSRAIGTLNVAGPRAGKFPDIYGLAAAFLEQLLT